MPNAVFNAGSRQLQGRFGTRDKADRAQFRVEFGDDDRAFVEGSASFLLATVDADGSPDCSYRGGQPGRIQVVGPDSLAFPNHDGNGQYRSLGNVLVNPEVAMPFIDFESPGRGRINGSASLHYDDPLLAEHPGARLMVLVRVGGIFGNCPGYVHKMELKEYAPHPPARLIPVPTT